jgi:hypothetical protein
MNRNAIEDCDEEDEVTVAGGIFTYQNTWVTDVED